MNKIVAFFTTKLPLTAAALIIAGSVHAEEPGVDQSAAKVSFGVIADIHYGWLRTGGGSIELGFVRDFLDDMHGHGVDFIIELGDLVKPPRSAPVLELWNTFDGPAYHVLGNHDNDNRHSFDDVARMRGMPGRYYTFDQGALRGIVLDDNEPGVGIGGEQLEWLARQLAESDRPVIIFVHQPPESSRNGAAVLEAIRASEAERPGLVLAVMHGHHHRDYMKDIDGVPHIQINSASYVWLGGPVRYAEPLWGRVEIDFENGTFQLHGRATTWHDKTPWELGADEDDKPRDVTRPAISDRQFRLKPETVAIARKVISE